METGSSKQKNLGVFQLVMIAIISVDSLRNIPIIAQYGLSLISFFIFAGITFFFPLTWISSQLAVRFPTEGGSYIWIEKAFGKSFAYLSIWLQWVYNIIYYPTIFAFISSIIITLVCPTLNDNKWLILMMCTGLFWIITAVHSRGIHMSSWVSTTSALVGTLFPMVLVIGLAAYSLLTGAPSAISLTANKLLPDAKTLEDIGYFSNVLFSLVGIEVIAMFTSNVANPGKTYPKTLLISAPVILLSLTLSSLALCIVIPPEQIGLISGIMDVFGIFFKDHFPLGTIIIGWCIVIGGMGIASSWMIGLARGLHVAFKANNAPVILQKLNKNNVPVNILIFQGIIYTLLLSAFLLLPNVNSSYWLLSALTAQFALLYYVLLFLAALKLLPHPSHNRFRKVMNYLIPLTAGVVSLIGIGVGFKPPSSIGQNNVLLYELFMTGSLIFFCLVPFYFLKKTKTKVALP